MSLGQFIQAGLAQDASHPGDLGIQNRLINLWVVFVSLLSVEVAFLCQVRS